MPKRNALLRSGSAVAFARLFSLVCAAVQLPLLTNLLSPGEYSAIAIAIAIATYFNLLSAEPIILGFERFPGTKSDRLNYRYAMSRTLLHVGVASAVVLLVALPLGLLDQAVAFIGWGIGIAINRLISLTWLMWEEPWQYAWNLTAGTGARTAVLVSLVVLGLDPLLSLGLAGLASAVAALSLSPRARTRVGALRPKTSEREPKPPRPWPFRFGLNLAFASLGYTLLTNANLLILALFVSEDSVGAYAVMLQVATLTSGAVLGLILAVAYPPLRRAWDSGQQDMVSSRLRLLQLLSIAVAAGFIVVCYVGDSFFLRLVFPSDYIEVAVLAPLIAGTAFATMGGMASWHHQLHLESARVARRTVIAATVGIAGTLLLTMAFHERGAAAGSVLGFLLYLIIMQAGTRLPSSTIVFAAGTALATSALFFVQSASSNYVTIPALLICALALAAVLRSYRRQVAQGSSMSASEPER
jgi:O-antigen/teichoic acid export membrane protein